MMNAAFQRSEDVDLKPFWLARRGSSAHIVPAGKGELDHPQDNVDDPAFHSGASAHRSLRQ
jgi:hypothetical protein